LEAPLQRTRFKGGRIAVLCGRNQSGEERTDRRTENRPSLPRGHHFTTTILRRSKGRSGFVPIEHRDSPASGDSREGGNSISGACRPPCLRRRPPLALWVRTAFAPPPDPLCHCKFSSPENRSTGLLGLAFDSKSSTGPGGERVLATGRFQYATSIDGSFLFSSSNR
jgi:hypothetical protein